MYTVYDEDTFYKYFVSLHSAVNLLTGNDVGPRTLLCIGMAIFGLFMGAIINANLFGELAVLVSQLSVKSQKYLNKMNKINTSIMNLNLPKSLEDGIRDFVITNQSSLEAQEELAAFMELLNPSMRSRVIQYEFYDVIKNQEIFGHDEKIVQAVLEKLQLKLY
jgi:hypothetical protein